MATAVATAPKRLVLRDDAVVLAASDMHIGEHDADTAAFFIEQLNGSVAGHSHLLLLGDLFEAWPGDDQQDVQAQKLVETLARISADGVSVMVMRGNRDFLLQVPIPGSEHADFCEQTGASMLADPTCLHLGGQRIVLAHGDSLCTDDTDYQAFRRLARSAPWQQNFLSRPLAERVQLARAYRQASKDNHQQRQMQHSTDDAARAMAIADVSQQAVDDLLTQCGYPTLIHGHTHRPDCHRWPDTGADPQVDAPVRQRLVLSDWDGASRRGGFVRISATEMTPLPVS